MTLAPACSHSSFSNTPLEQQAHQQQPLQQAKATAILKMPIAVHAHTSASARPPATSSAISKAGGASRMIPKGTLPVVIPLVVGSLAFAEFAHEYERERRECAKAASSAQDEEAQHAHALHDHILSPWKGAR